MATVSETQKPEPRGDVTEWERGLDPWHADAFKGTPMEGTVNRTGERQSGWYGLDWCGNVISWVPDGAETEQK